VDIEWVGYIEGGLHFGAVSQTIVIEPLGNSNEVKKENKTFLSPAMHEIVHIARQFKIGHCCRNPLFPRDLEALSAFLVFRHCG
jgi:hypothetical protein